MHNSTSAPGKVILFGEHAVVYGIPAIAIPLSALRVRVKWTKDNEQGLQILAHDLKNENIILQADKEDARNPLTLLVNLILKHYDAPTPSANFEIKSDIPIASGLGSGAAVSTALGRAVASALGYKIEDDLLNSIVYEIEKIHHGTPSGIDNTVIVYEKAIKFKKHESIEYLSVKNPFTIIVADTGIPSLTHDAVGDVKKLYNANEYKYQQIFDDVATIVDKATQYIESGNTIALGHLMTENHSLLQSLTVSSVELDRLVNTAINAGALGAKLSGGGRGGNMIALVHNDDAKNIAEKLRSAGAKKTFITLVK